MSKAGATKEAKEYLYFITDDSDVVLGFARGKDEDQAIERAGVSTGLDSDLLFAYKMELNENLFVHKDYIIIEESKNRFGDEDLENNDDSEEDGVSNHHNELILELENSW